VMEQTNASRLEGRVTRLCKRVTGQRHGDSELAQQQDPVVVVGIVPCKIPQDGQLKRLEARGIVQEARRNSGRIEAKRARIMSASGHEIVGLGFSLLTGVGIHKISHEKGESS
jgi:hypothetical protein